MAQSEPTGQTETNALSSYLIQFKLEHLYTKLKENNITTIVTLAKLTENELATLCDKLELNDDDAVKLKQLYQQNNRMKSNSTPIKQVKPVKKTEINLTQMDDMQHIFETYFTEIESSCNCAQKQIDEKFQEIIKTLKTKQKQLTQQINEWKLNKLENVNNEISDIMQYKNAHNSASETIHDNKFNKYKNSSDLIKHIQSITPLISIDFNSKSIDNIKNELSSLTNMKTRNYISFPNIILSKPNEFMDKNEGYCIKLNWKFEYYNQNINKDNFIIKYKMDKKLNEDEKEYIYNNEWKMCKHGSISLIKSENESIMKTQLIDVMKLNKLYKCEIEYLMKKPINIGIKSNICEFININSELKEEELNKINLEYYSHRSYSLTRHPKYLLLNSDTKQYWSSFNKDFKSDECDWIIYKYKNFEINKKWIPKKIIFKNYKSNQDVRKMIVYIGNVKNKQWYPLTKNYIQPKLSKELQYFNVDNFDVKLAKDEKCIYIKLEFLENYGENNPDMCRFCCRHFRLMGVH